MELNNIIYSALSIGGIGVTFGLVLGLAAKKFSVEVDPKVTEVRDALPGSNCGACGFPGCDGLAKAIANGEAAVNACPVGGSDTASRIATIMGSEAGDTVKNVAFVKCNGTCEVAKEKYIYDGVKDCKSASMIPGQGSKGCDYGCLGLESCVKVCQFDALKVENGVAVVDEEKCTSCGLCVGACPKGLIEIVPSSSKVRVQCNSKDKGKDVKANCSVGCIACRLCTKACEFEAVEVKDNIAHINYEKCTQCNACAEKCPVKIITPAS
jgi:Na+-translocating ferredoxin:NAD+ oxidoreductase RNF subunit RnfB